MENKRPIEALNFIMDEFIKRKLLYPDLVDADKIIRDELNRPRVKIHKEVGF
ncbi:hypothetical protein KAR91_18135 [Candidatus Pacearchaeota archaeon]|nr:hypothetical protein [Candidatus Pacearchaeota archaeon]